MAKKRKRTMPRAIIRIGNPGRDAVKIIIPGRSRKAATAHARRFVKRHIKNIEMGFHDSTGFHPIRASHDFSGPRAGEFKHSATVGKLKKSRKRKR